jgi:hypothetical protein
MTNQSPSRLICVGSESSISAAQSILRVPTMLNGHKISIPLKDLYSSMHDQKLGIAFYNLHLPNETYRGIACAISSKNNKVLSKN